MNGDPVPTTETKSEASQWLDEHGSLVGFPMECKSNPGEKHPLVKFSRKRYNEQMAVFRASKKPTTFRCSPDVVHMIVGGRKSAAMLDHTLICDPGLIADTILLT